MTITNGAELCLQLKSNDLTHLEKAKLVQTLIDAGYSQAEIARSIEKSRSYVNKLVNLARADLTVIEAIENHQISASTVMKIWPTDMEPKEFHAVLQKAAVIAQSRGKSKASYTDVQRARAELGWRTSAYQSETAIAELRQRVTATCWEKATPEVLVRVDKLLADLGVS